MNWWAKKGSGNQGVVSEDGGTGRTVAVACDAKDAVMLAAAPEMLTALQGLLATCELNTDDMEDETRIAIRAAQDAVRNAKGEL
jgi:hypothetical protein